MEKRLTPLVCRTIPIFSSLSDAALEPLCARAALVRFEAGCELCREGDAADSMFIVEDGEISVLKSGDAASGAVEVAVLRPGDVAGELSLFGPSVRSATLRAKTDVSAWCIGHDEFGKLLDDCPALGRGLLEHIANHLRRETSAMARLLARDVDRRFKVAFFDSKPYLEEAFRAYNPYNYCYRFFQTRLTPDTVSMAAGHNAVSCLANDQVDATVVGELAGMGIRLVALSCAGYNNVDLAACARAGVSVVRVPAYSPESVAEHAAALILALNRRIPRAQNRVREGNFSLTGLVGFNLRGKTAGLVGAGKIGRCLLSILRGFGCRLLVHNRTPDPTLESEFGAEQVSMDDLLARSDIVSLHAPLTAETRHMIDARRFAQMKRGVMLINTGRGGLIDTKALLEALKSGQVGYAGLDVYEGESEYFFQDTSGRVMTDDVLARLLTFNNVIVTGHQAFLTREALASIAGTTIENIREFELGKKGRELTNHVPV